jgi:hypothetical protein
VLLLHGSGSGPPSTLAAGCCVGLDLDLQGSQGKATPNFILTSQVVFDTNTISEGFIPEVGASSNIMRLLYESLA